MQDVRSTPTREARRDQDNDRPLLGLGRTGCQVRRVRERVRAGQAYCRRSDRIGELGVHDQQSVERRDLRHRLAELIEIQRWELGHT